jgi:hypothetical protein
VEPAGDRRLRRAVAVAIALAFLRSAVFVFCEGADFDSDQAVFGLMAKHLAEGRAFPLYMYGQRYILGVEAWLAAPVIALLGPTVTALKLPVLAANLAVAGLLVSRLAADAGVAPRAALVAALPFALPPVPIAALLTESPGGNVEPLLWILLLWVLRARPLLFGLVGGLGFLNREFTAYGPIALALVQAARGEILTRRALRFWLQAAAVFAAVLLAVHLLQPYSTNPAARTPVVEWQGARAAGLRLAALAQTLLPALFGLRPGPFAEAGLRGALLASPLGKVIAPAAVAAAVLFALRLAALAWRARPLPRRADFPAYLLLVGAQTLAAYALVGIGLGAPAYVRYVLFAIFVPIAAVSLHQRLEPSRGARAAVLAAVTAWAALSGFDHARLGLLYATDPPAYAYRALADDLVARGIRYGAADYWIAYHVTYLAGERVRLDARGFSRDPEYRRLFRENLAEAVDVRAGAAGCPGRVVAGEFCVVGPPAPLKRRQASTPAPAAP